MAASRSAEARRQSATREAAESFGLQSWRWQPALMPLPHRHSEIELNLLLEGTVTYVHRDRFVKLAPHQLAIFWAAIPHQLIERDPACDFCILTLPLDLLLGWKLPPAFVQALLMGEFLVDADPTNAQIDFVQVPRWHADLSSGRPAVTLKEMESRLWRWASTWNPASVGSWTADHDSKAGWMAHYIVDNYEEPLTVEGIARAVGLHPNYAMTCFKQTFGMTILEYTLQYRVAQAQRLLVTTDSSVLDVAMRSGFGSLSAFYTAFRRYTGQTPRVGAAGADRSVVEGWITRTCRAPPAGADRSGRRRSAASSRSRSTRSECRGARPWSDRGCVQIHVPRVHSLRASQPSRPTMPGSPCAVTLSTSMRA